MLRLIFGEEQDGVVFTQNSPGYAYRRFQLQVCQAHLTQQIGQQLIQSLHKMEVILL
jgi:hypothetical protein